MSDPVSPLPSPLSPVLYLDADVIVASNVDDAFECASFCAVLRHSERFNTGVMLVSPDTALFTDMMTQMHVLPSYTGGEEAPGGTLSY